MGITLVEHVLDHAPDDLTPAEWRGLIVLAQDANEKSRVTFHGPNDPLILRRVRMSESRWNSVRSALVKKGALEQVAGGYKGAVAKYRIPFFAAGLVAENRQPSDPERLPETEPKVAGIRHQRLPKTGNPTPPSSSPSSSTPSDPPAASSPEGGGGGLEVEQAIQFLMNLPDNWACGRASARRLAPLLLERIGKQGWDLDTDLERELTKNPRNIGSFAAVLPGRIDDLRKRSTRRTRDSPPPRVGLPLWCGSEDCNQHTRMRTELDGPNGYPVSSPCPACHPDMIKDTAA